MLLAIDTSTRYAGIAIADQERVLASRCWHSTGSHTAQLMPAISNLLKELDLSVGELDGMAVALGPGGFSALRVGLSTAKGLALAAGKPLVGVGTLDLEAFPYLASDHGGSGFGVCAILDSGRKEIASARFGADGLRTRADTICEPDELLSEFAQADNCRAEVAQPIIFCGEGVANWRKVLQDGLGSQALIISHSSAARLWSLAEMGRQRLDAGESDDLAELQPYYLRMPSIGGPKRRDLMPQRP